MTMQYKNPPTTPSSAGTQFNTFWYDKKAIIESAKDQYFTPLADTKNMPKNYGKTIKVYHYVPLLDDRNINDQGLDATGATIANGNLYGSSKDIGTITGALPLLTENGGRVNRVGYTRLELSGSIRKFGFFHEYTQESLDFDTDEMLYEHWSREMVTGATQITEAVLQIDLLTAAGVIVYTGAATTVATLTPEGADPSVVTYEDLSRLSIALNDNRTPKQTKVITGSRMIDTKTINSGRVMFIGSELEMTCRDMLDQFNNPAFIPVHKYAAAAGTTLNGEIGTIGDFRIVVVPEMLKWGGAGATIVSNPGYRFTGTKYDVYPMLVVGEASFTTIGFQTDGKSTKFKIIVKKPGEKMADLNDPYGEKGFSSIKWWYGFMGLRTERIAVVKTCAKI